jgi:hypothetical protein
MTTLAAPSIETEILRRTLDAQLSGMTPEVARFLLNMRLSPEDTARVEVLSAKAEEGTLTPAEEEELDHYLRHGRFMEILQLRARRVLNQSGNQP